MHEFWLKEKLILIIGLFQYGLVLIMFTIINLSKLVWGKLMLGKQNVIDENSLTPIKSAAIATSSPNEVNEVTDAVNNNPANHELNLEPTLTEPVDDRLTTQLEPTVVVEPEVDLVNKVEISPELLTELREISSDPTAIIDEAIRLWLRRRTLDVLDSSTDRKYRVGMRSDSSRRSLQDLWND